MPSAHSPEELAAAPADPTERKKYFNRLRQRKWLANPSEEARQARREKHAAAARARRAALSEEARQAQRERAVARLQEPAAAPADPTERKKYFNRLRQRKWLANPSEEARQARREKHAAAAQRGGEASAAREGRSSGSRPQGCAERGSEASAARTSRSSTA